MNKKTLVIVFLTSLISQSAIVAGGNEDIKSHKNNAYINPNKSIATETLKTGAALTIVSNPLANSMIIEGGRIISGGYIALGFAAYGAYKYYQSHQSPQESLKKN